MPDPGPSDSATINEATAARLLEISPRMLRHLVGKGWIPRHSRGRYTVVGVVHGYIAYRDHLDEKRTGTAADSDLRRAKQREIEQRMAQRDAELIDIIEHQALGDETLGILADELAGLPSRLPRSLRRAAKAEITGMLERAQERFNRATAELIATGRAPVFNPEEPS